MTYYERLKQTVKILWLPSTIFALLFIYHGLTSEYEYAWVISVVSVLVAYLLIPIIAAVHQMVQGRPDLQLTLDRWNQAAGVAVGAGFVVLSLYGYYSLGVSRLETASSIIAGGAMIFIVLIHRHAMRQKRNDDSR